MPVSLKFRARWYRALLVLALPVFAACGDSHLPSNSIEPLPLPVGSTERLPDSQVVDTTRRSGGQVWIASGRSPARILP